MRRRICRPPLPANSPIDGRNVQMPLVVADRGIREVSAGAELLGNLLELIGSRCSVDGVMLVATSPLVLDQLGVTKNCRNLAALHRAHQYSLGSHRRTTLSCRPRMPVQSKPTVGNSVSSA